MMIQRKHIWYIPESIQKNEGCGRMKYPLVISQASFQLRPFKSTKILISSGMHSVGWVSFICTATFDGNSSHFTLLPDLFSNREIISWREAEHNVYCCFNLRVFPSSDSSPGYNTKHIWCHASIPKINFLTPLLHIIEVINHRKGDHGDFGQSELHYIKVLNESGHNYDEMYKQDKNQPWQHFLDLHRL